MKNATKKLVSKKRLGFSTSLAIAALTGLVSLCTSSPVSALEDSRIIVETPNQVISGNHSGIDDKNNWNGWWSEWSVEGGIVKNKSQNLTINNAVFDGNTFTVHNPSVVDDKSEPNYMGVIGGVIGNTTGSTISSIKNVTFSNNVANATYNGQTVKGGIIGNLGKIDSIDNIQILNNKTNGFSYGGGIYNEGEITTISNSEIANNSGASGSAIYNKGKISTIDNVNIHDNKGTSILNIGTIETIKNSHITNNTESGIDNRNVGGSQGYIGSIENTEISNNQQSGILSFDASIGSIKNSTFFGNKDGGLYSYRNSYNNSNVYTIGNIEGSTFSENTGKGAINLFNVSVKDIKGTKFLNNTSSGGGAISFLSNDEFGHSIGNIGDKDNQVLFEGNKALGSYSSGGAILFNGGGSKDITVGNLENVIFRNNSAVGSGGAIAFNHNNVIIGKLNNVLFDGNKSETGVGGAIAVNSGKAKLGNFTNVVFQNNIAKGSGSAIYGKDLTLGDFKDVSFINNKSTDSSAAGVIYGMGSKFGNWDGGGIYGDGTSSVLDVGGIYLQGSSFKDISNVTFKDLHATDVAGGIYNSGSTVGDLTNVTFYNVTAERNAGVIYNQGSYSYVNGSYQQIGGIFGNLNNVKIFNNNSTRETVGAAIYNAGTIGNWNGGCLYGFGKKDSGIANNGKFGNISDVEFYNLHSTNAGGIWNNGGVIGDLSNVKFWNVSAKESGGTIWNNATIGNLTNNVIFQNSSSEDSGGAIFNLSKIGNINASFINNSASVNGGAIWNNNTIGDINNSYFNGNHVISTDKDATGGAIYNLKNTFNINNSIFRSNYVKSTNKDAYGGAIVYFDNSNPKDINADFVSNYAQADNGNAKGGAIVNFNKLGTISSSSSTYYNNSAKSVSGDAFGGFLYNTGTIDNIKNVTFLNNSVESKSGKAQGGAIYNVGDIVQLENDSFIGNIAKSSTGIAQGGAIYTLKDMNIVAKDGYTSLFSGNSVTSNSKKEQNAIYVDKSNLTLTAKNNGKFVFNDTIDGQNYKLNMTGESTGEIYINNAIKNADISQNNVTSYVNEASLLNYNNSLSINSGIMNINHMGMSPLNFNSFANSGTININSVDINPATETMGRLTANNYGAQTGSINVNGLNVLADPIKETTNVLFADSAFANSVKYNGSNVYMGKIYKYNVDYLPESGEFQFIRGGGSSGADSFNPTVLSTGVSSQAGTNATVNETFKYVFEHADAFTQLPSMDRFAMINENRYALSTDFNDNLPRPNASEFNNKAGWFRPYVTFEKMNLRNAGAVNATTYGSLFGFDSDFQHYKRGWTGITTGYVGYNGSQLRYSGADTTMNGGLLGFTQSFYKGNFWTALTLSAGASVGESNTMYGKEDFTTLFAGLGSKTGYNIEFKQGKYIIQPVWFMSYTFGKTFDYTNAAGVRMDSSPMHSIMLNPSVRFIANAKNGWQPYFSVGMVWNALSESDVKANGVKLPEASIKPYVEYGLGVQKRFKDHFVAFLQAMIRNGGRNGISMTAGFRWAIGHECHWNENEKVSKPQQKVSLKNNSNTQIKSVEKTTAAPKRKIIKQLAKDTNNSSTITTTKAVLKQL